MAIGQAESFLINCGFSRLKRPHSTLSALCQSHSIISTKYVSLSRIPKAPPTDNRKIARAGVYKESFITSRSP